MITESKSEAQPKSLSVVEIAVEKLFGSISYRLKRDEADLSQLFLLYGENGSGKTTILRAVFALLDSSDDTLARKNLLSSVSFSRISIRLNNGFRVSATRKESARGPYRYELFENRKLLASADFGIEQRNTFGPSITSDQRNVISSLANLSTAVYFVGDDRSVRGGNISEKSSENDLSSSIFYQGLYDGKPKKAPSQDESLSQTVRRLEESFRRQALYGVGVGFGNTDTIYLKVFEDIVTRYAAEDSKNLTETLERILTQVFAETKRSSEYSRYGLGSVPEAERIRTIAENAQGSQLRALLGVLQPYLEGLSARLDAVAPLYDSIDTFIEAVARFFTGKTVNYNIRDGLTITSDTGTNLSPTELSSGEKQLLLLLCNTLATERQQSIVIIDEPELSLNIKWQRQLLDALKDCDRNGNIQFIIATHSIELLTGQNDHIVIVDSQTE